MASSEMQFYLSAAVDCDDLIKVLSDLLGMKVETLEQPDSEALAFLLVTRYNSNFSMGISLSWREDIIPKHNYLEIAKYLANNYNIQVATDLPEGHPSKLNPYYWCVAEPDGTLLEMVEDTSGSEERDGLILNVTSKKIIQ